MATVNCNKEILSTILTRGSLHGATKYSYRSMKAYNQTHKHNRGQGNTTKHRKGKTESVYKQLVRKHLLVKSILELKDQSIAFGNTPNNNQSPTDFLINRRDYTEFEIEKALRYFEGTMGVKLKQSENGYYVFRIFDDGRHEIILDRK